MGSVWKPYQIQSAGIDACLNFDNISFFVFNNTLFSVMSITSFSCWHILQYFHSALRFIAYFQYFSFSYGGDIFIYSSSSHRYFERAILFFFYLFLFFLLIFMIIKLLLKRHFCWSNVDFISDAIKHNCDLINHINCLAVSTEGTQIGFSVIKFFTFYIGFCWKLDMYSFIHNVSFDK